jgi:V8-like Glu-specific endopeptidase
MRFCFVVRLRKYIASDTLYLNGWISRAHTGARSMEKTGNSSRISSLADGRVVAFVGAKPDLFERSAYMATKEKKPKVESSGHTSVSNQGTEAAAVVKPSFKPPSEGVNPKTIKPADGGYETVKGFKLREVSEAELAEIYAAPDTSALRDIGEASFGPPLPVAETVHGPDDRVQITTTAVYPWRVHASLLITAADNSSWIGTGWFIGPHTLMTAGHVVFIKNSGVPGRDGWVKKIQVMPGRNGATLPYGSVTSTNFRSVTAWTNSGDENFDYGAIIIPNNLGNTVGWFGFGVYSDADLLASVGNISGYPGDKPNGTQWYDARRVASVNSKKVYYDIDTVGGQSGSAVYRIINGQRVGIAIHAYGGATTNSGTRIVTAVYNNMVNWKA